MPERPDSAPRDDNAGPLNNTPLAIALDALHRISDGSLDALGIPQHAEAVRSGDGDYLVIQAMEDIAREAVNRIEWEVQRGGT